MFSAVDSTGPIIAVGELSQNIQKDPADDQQARIEAARTRPKLILWTIFFAPLLATMLAWCLFSYWPQSACYFRDNSLLRNLWPPNSMAFDQVQALSYLESEKCLFFGIRSVASLTSTIFCFILSVAILTDAKSIPIENASLGKLSIAFFVLTILFFTPIDNFNEYHGRGAAFGFHPTNSMTAILIKSLIRIYPYQFMFWVWLVCVIEYLKRNRIRKPPSYYDRPPWDRQ